MERTIEKLKILLTLLMQAKEEKKQQEYVVKQEKNNCLTPTEGNRGSQR